MLAPDIDADLVAGTLYQGSAPIPTRTLRKSVHAICFAAWEYQPPKWWPDVMVLRAYLDDSGLPMDKDEKFQAVKVARQVRKLLDRNRTVLVTCHAGMNRSGLICALALGMPSMHQCRTPSNLTPAQAISAVRKARGPYALSNDYFVAFIESMGSLRSLSGSMW